MKQQVAFHSGCECIAFDLEVCDGRLRLDRQTLTEITILVASAGHPAIAVDSNDTVYVPNAYGDWISTGVSITAHFRLG